MANHKLIKVLANDDGSFDKTRVSGTGSFPAPQPEDIGRKVIVTRACITWDGCLGYFEDDCNHIKHAFYNDELEESK
jgi:hypothetical protein